MNRSGSGCPRDRVKGLLVFNQDSTMVRKPEIDEVNLKVSYQRETKVTLHHLSAIDDSLLEECVDLGLDYIWKTMHCSVIKINLHHYMQDDEKNPGQQRYKGNETLKSIFKKRLFRWKTLKNEMNGSRIETLEGANCHFKEQLKPETAFIFRRDLKKADLLKDTVNVSIVNKLTFGKEKTTATSSSEAPVSLSSLICDIISKQ